ncbi:hypothetical protein Q5P01_024806 [Channa striata]|uniref:Nucleolar protein 14 n=1 Tax=Channa striata TaxID=64152 RepID=A0AA88J4R3_CHASR|nr:hypothetical protein Q5P01_024806 [Channa striata]
MAGKSDNPFSHFDEPRKFDPSFRGPLHNRGCTDVFCCFVFVIVIFGYIALGTVAWIHGDPRKVIHPTDSYGQFCGQKNTPNANKTILFYFNILKCANPTLSTNRCPTIQLCVSKCPNRLGTLQDAKNSQKWTYYKQFCKPGFQMGNQKPAPLMIVPSRPFHQRCLPDFFTRSDGKLTIANKTSFKDGENKTRTVSDFEKAATGVSSLLNAKEVQVKISEDYANSWYWILIGLAIAMVASLLFILLLHFTSGALLWVIIVGVIVAVAYGIVHCYREYSRLSRSPVAQMTSDILHTDFSIYLHLSQTWLIFMILLIVTEVIIVIMLIFLRKRLCIAVALLKEGKKAISYIMSTLFYPIITFLLIALCITYCAITAVFLALPGNAVYKVKSATASCKYSSLTCNPKTFSQTNITTVCPGSKCLFAFYAGENVYNRYAVVLHLCNLFVLLWLVNFTLALGQCTLAGAFASYYWALKKPNDIPACPLYSSFSRAICYHAGSLAFGSVILSMVQMVRIVLTYLDQKLKGSRNVFTRYLLCCLKCCFWCLEHFIRFLNRNAYIMMAINGKNFWTSSKDAFFLLMRNVIRVAVLDKVTDFLLFLGKLLITGSVVPCFLSPEFNTSSFYKMGKPQKKTSVADKVRKTKTSAEIKNNPFEVKINRKKFDVLGRKTKHDVGLPGVSRSKAITKRKETLLKEYQLKNKSSKFIDRRFGEYDTKMAPEDKILQRFAMERQRVHDKKDLYNLNEEEELTHYGQSLAEMEKFNDTVHSDDESEEKGLLSAELTASHFGGGGLLRKKGSGEQSQEEEGSQRAKSRQELIEELIQKSKQEKRERQVQKEEAQELTEKLDQEWKNIQALMVKKAPKAENAEKQEEKPKLDEYDMMVRELGFEMKAQPSEKMKTPEELAREEREKLQKLEADRLRRMMGDDIGDSAPAQVHLSADDLNDGFILDKDDKKTLAYQDGKWNIEERSEGDGDENSEEGESDEEQVSEEEEEDGDEDDEDEEDEEEEEEGEEGEGSSEEEEDGHSDLDSEQESEDEERQEEKQTKKKKSLSKEEMKAQQDAAKAELPYTFNAPESFSDLRELLHGHTPDNQRLIVARTQKCNHPSLGVGNKLKLQKLFGFLLEYIGELATRSPPELTVIDKLIPELYTLCQMFPEAACKSMQSILGDAAHSMEEVLEVKGHATFPALDMLVYLKVTSLLFPTSDFRHPVTTPALLYIGQALTKCPVRSLQDVTSGLVLCCLAVDYASLSKRFLPELINFLAGTLHLAVQDKTSLAYSVVPPFKPSGKHSDLLVLSDSESCKSWSKKDLPLSAAQHLDLKNDLATDNHRLMCLSTCLDLVKRSCLLYKDLTSFPHIMQPIRLLLSKHLLAQTLPKPLQELHSEILETINNASVSHSRLVFDKKKPIPLKLLTPKIVEVLDYGKKRGSTREEKEKERLKHKYKKEFKGALREIRKDSRFLAREKLNEIMSRDAERKRKVKELFGSLATQEGEWKALKRKKRK